MRGRRHNRSRPRTCRSHSSGVVALRHLLPRGEKASTPPSPLAGEGQLEVTDAKRWSSSRARGVTQAEIAVAAVGVTFTGGLATQAGKLLGVGSSAVTIWDIAKWPVILAIVLTMLSILYWASPNVKHPRFRWVSAGGILGVVVWLLASAAFALYVANFASYNKTYGAFGGVIVFLVWLWISNIAILLGAEFDAELERGRQIQAGHPAKDDPFLEPRDTRKL